MSALLRAELLKLRTTRTFAALTGAAITISLLITILFAALGDFESDDVIDVFNSDMTSLFIVFLGLMGIAGEWRHRTITSALLAAPDRLRFLAAKTVAYAAAGALLSVLISVSVLIAGTIVLGIRDIPMPAAGDLLERFALNVLIAALLGAFAVGIGAILRNQVVAVIGVLIYWFFVENALIALVPEIGRFTPFTGLPGAIANLDPDDVGLPDGEQLLSQGAAFAAMLAWIAVTFAAGVALLKRRDVH